MQCRTCACLIIPAVVLLLGPTACDATISPEGPLELFFLGTESIAGQRIQDPADERVIEYLDEQIRSLSPAMRHTGQPAAIQTDVGKGAVLAWRATGPDGRQITARVFVTFARETAAMLIGIGRKERVDARDKDLRDLFKSVTPGQARLPPAIPSSREPM